MSQKITFTVRNAETNERIATLEWKGKTVSPSVLIIPVVQSSFGPKDVLAWTAAVLKDPNNAPIAPGEGGDKSMVGAPDGPPLSVFAGTPHIMRIDNGAMDVDLGDAAEAQVGWWVVLIPQKDGSQAFEIQDQVYYRFDLPLVFVTKTDIKRFEEQTTSGDTDSAGHPYVTSSTDYKVDVWTFPSDLSALAREVIEKRLFLKPEFEKIQATWGGGLQVGIVDQAHYFLENKLIPVRDERLRTYWINNMSWAVMDEHIHAREFDELLTNYAQMQAILYNVPWPDIKWFDECAQGLAFVQARDGTRVAIGEHRLYVTRLVDYFPRADAEITAELALIWFINLPTILQCVIAKVEAFVQKLKKLARFYKYLGIGIQAIITALSALIPGSTGIVLTATELVVETAEARFLKNVDPKLVKLLNLTVGLVVGIVSGNIVNFQTLLDQIQKPAFDEAAKLAQTEFANLAAKDIKAKAGELMGFQELPAEIMPFVIWLLMSSIMGAFYAALASQAGGTDVDAIDGIAKPMEETAKAQGVPIPASVDKLIHGGNILVPVLVTGGGIAAVLTVLWAAGEL